MSDLIISKIYQDEKNNDETCLYVKLQHAELNANDVAELYAFMDHVPTLKQTFHVILDVTNMTWKSYLLYFKDFLYKLKSMDGSYVKCCTVLVPSHVAPMIPSIQHLLTTVLCSEKTIKIKCI